MSEYNDFCDSWLQSWTGNRSETLLSFYHPEAFYSDPSQPQGLKGQAELKKYFEKLLAKNPDWIWEREELIPTEKGFYLKWKATLPGPITTYGLDIVELQDGKIIRNEVYFDTASLAKKPEPKPAAKNEAPAAGTWLLYSDGACRGNPGESGAGALVIDPEGNETELCRYLGHKTNNQAEYEALLLGINHLIDLGVQTVEIRADSELMIRQLKGEYKVKNEGLLPLYQEARDLLKRFKQVTLKHVPREENTHADALSNRAIDEK